MVFGAIGALTSALFFMTGCNPDAAKVNQPPVDAQAGVISPAGGPVVTTPTIPVDVPVPVPVPTWHTIELLARLDPADPHNERFLDDWVFRLFNIDDDARISGPIFEASSGPNGNANM